MKQKNQSNWFQQLFCQCVREEPAHENRFLRSVSSNMILRREEKNEPKQIESQQWLNKIPSFEVDYSEEVQQDLFNRQLSYVKDESKMQKTSFSEEFNSCMLDMKLLHKCGGLLARQTSCQVDASSYEWIIKIFKDNSIDLYDLNKDFEKKYRSQLVPSSIVAAINKRIKSETLLLTHDPTGSVLLKLSCRKILYIEQELTFRKIIEGGIKSMHVQAQKILKMDIENMFPIVLINLYHDNYLYLKNIVYEYLQFAHNLIVILPNTIDNNTVFMNVEQAISLSEQSKQSCSIDLQHIVEGNQVIAKVLYFGDVSEITLNDELNFLYSCISNEDKKNYNYKLLIKDLRHELGMSELVRAFDRTNLLRNSSMFAEFVNQFNHKKSYDQVNEDQSSSTESESDEEEVEEVRVEQPHYHSEENSKSHQYSLSPVKKRGAHSQPQKC